MKNGRVDILTFTQTLTTPYTCTFFRVQVASKSNVFLLFSLAVTWNVGCLFGMFVSLLENNCNSNNLTNAIETLLVFTQWTLLHWCLSLLFKLKKKYKFLHDILSRKSWNFWLTIRYYLMSIQPLMKIQKSTMHSLIGTGSKTNSLATHCWLHRHFIQAKRRKLHHFIHQAHHLIF